MEEEPNGFIIKPWVTFCVEEYKWEIKNMKALFNILFLVVSINLFSQDNIVSPEIKIPLRVNAIVVGVDTFAYVSLPMVSVEAAMPFATKRKYAEWTRLKHNVKKAYPYAILASARLKQYEMVLEKLPNDDTRKAYMAVAEKQLQKEFGEELKNLLLVKEEF